MCQDPVTFVIFADSENPAEKEDPSFKLNKVHSASTVISNLSLISASIESDLDTKTDGSTHDVTSVGGSSMRAKNSITTRSVKSGAQPSSASTHSVAVAEPERRSLRALSKSQVLPVYTNKHTNPANSYASFNGHVRTNNRQPSTSSLTDHSRTPSIPDPSDSDIDSYSDIVGQRSWKDSVNHQSVDLSGANSRKNSANQGVANGAARSWASSSNPTGSVISFGNQQRRVIEDPARTTKQNSKMNGTRQSTPNLSNINGDVSPREGGAYRGRPQKRSRSESQDPVQQNGPRSIAYGRSKSIPRQKENGSSDEEETEHAHDRRWKSSSTHLRVNRVITGLARTNEPELLRVSSVDLPARGESLGSSGNKTTATRNGDYKANHAEELAAEMQQGRRNSLPGREQSFPKFRDDSQSSQDSTDYESRQTAAEWAAAALMSNHVTHVPAQPATNKLNPQAPLEMRDMGAENRKLRREHLANLAHLQSSSC